VLFPALLAQKTSHQTQKTSHQTTLGFCALAALLWTAQPAAADGPSPNGYAGLTVPTGWIIAPQATTPCQSAYKIDPPYCLTKTCYPSVIGWAQAER